jgi:hypothetical protein
LAAGSLDTARRFYDGHLKEWASTALLFPLCAYFVYKRGEYTLLDSADLIIHEAGHFFFRWFGEFMHAAGGTLMQLILPSLLAAHFFRHDYRFGTQVSLFWLGHNLINISVYASDARARALPLLGGDNVSHDWHFMLGRLGLLQHDIAIGHGFFLLAIIIFLILLILPRFMFR